MQLFYSLDINLTTKQFFFDKTESNHIVKVLRKKEGDLVFITNGLGSLFTTKISSANNKKCIVTILKVEQFAKPWNYYLHIAIAPTKLNDRFEWFLEKATEIGIDEITPIICNRSERKVVKIERMEKIIHSAAKQSLKYHFPKLNEALSFDEFLKVKKDGQLFIAHCEDSNKKLLKNELLKNETVTILIGPEGDFSLNEISASIQNNFSPISLGASRLRTETAGIVAVHSVAFVNE